MMRVVVTMRAREVGSGCYLAEEGHDQLREAHRHVVRLLEALRALGVKLHVVEKYVSWVRMRRNEVN